MSKNQKGSDFVFYDILINKNENFIDIDIRQYFENQNITIFGASVDDLCSAFTPHANFPAHNLNFH